MKTRLLFLALITAWVVIGIPLISSAAVLFYDDFGDGTYTDKWDEIVKTSLSTVTEANGELHLYSQRPGGQEGETASLRTKNSFSSPTLSITAKVKPLGYGGIYVVIWKDGNNFIRFGLNTNDVGGVEASGNNNGAWFATRFSICSPRCEKYYGNYHIWVIKKNGNTYEMYIDGALQGSYQHDSIGDSNLQIGLDSHTFQWKSGDAENYVDSIEVNDTQGVLPFHDDFGDGVYTDKWDEFAKSQLTTITEANGELHLYSQRPGGQEGETAWLLTKNAFSSPTMSITARVKPMGWGGIYVMIWKDGYNYIRFGLNTDDVEGVEASGNNNGSWFASRFGGGASYLGGYHTWVIRKTQNQYDFYIDDIFQGTYQHDSIGDSNLRIGLYSQTFQWKSGDADNYIDSIEVNNSPPPLPSGNRYWAVDVGNYWVYEGVSQRGPYTWKDIIMGVEDFQGVPAYVKEGSYLDGPSWVLDQKNWFSIVTSEVRMLQNAGWDSDRNKWQRLTFDRPGVLFFKNPMNPGDSWSISATGTVSTSDSPSGTPDPGSSMPITFTGTASVVSFGDVLTSLGTYKAYQIHIDATVLDNSQNVIHVTNEDYWFTPYIGQVKWQDPEESEVLSKLSLKNRGVDFNGDGKPDLLWRHTSGRTTIWYMDGATWNGGYADVVPTVSDPNWSIVGVADFNGDSQPDLLWRDASSGRTTIWYMEGPTWNGGYADVLPMVSDPNWSIVGVADFNGDSQPDLLWRDASSGRTTIWHMEGPTWNGGYADVVPTVSDPNWSIVGVADFNGDSKPDLLWRDSSSGRTTIWYMEGPMWNGGYADLVPTVSDSAWQIVGIRDFNNDGNPGLLWRNTSTYRATVWYMNGPTWNGNWEDVLPTVEDPDWTIVGK
jgi:hypothetical protein